MTTAAKLEELRAWMHSCGWQPLPHQEACWEAQLAGREGLLAVPTGMGKTYAAYLAALAEAAAAPRAGLRILWVSPLKALTRDIEASLKLPVEALGWSVSVGSRTGDTSSYRKRKLRERLPHVLVTTPESLSLLLSYEDAAQKFADLELIVVDEWHELLGDKRGTQTELALARLRRFSPNVRTWALSATLPDPDTVAETVLGPTRGPLRGPIREPGREATVITAPQAPALDLELVLGPPEAYLPWFGFLGGALFDAVVERLDPARSTLLFTNTRNQAERWYRAIIERRPEWFACAGLHHGSVDAAERTRVEEGLASGEVTLVVCTSSLDLGVDFSPVERVFQIGSPRGVARLLQRAGRSGHRPGARSEVHLVPTHAMQLLEFAALKRALEAERLEGRRALTAPVDVLVQHLVTCAAGGGFNAQDLFDEVRSTHAYAELPKAVFDWALAFVQHGGSTLRSYPQYRRVLEGADGRFEVADAATARRHRMAIGTIVSNSAVRVRFRNGRDLGLVEESAVARLKVGDNFLFAGRALELVAVRGTDVWVKSSKGAEHAPKWLGDGLPLSEPLAAATIDVLRSARDALEQDPGASLPPELERIDALLRRQMRVARIPDGCRMLAEVCRTASAGSHLFLFCFGGQLANRLLASLLAWRISRERPVTFALSANEYALELYTPEDLDFEALLAAPSLLATASLEADACAAVNAAELGRRQFRRIARIAGLIDEGLPSARKSARQLQTSAGLLYDVFARHEPDNLLLAQAQEEVLEGQFDARRLRTLLDGISTRDLEIVRTDRPSPMAFPLTLERVEGRVSSESLRRRIERMKAEWSSAMASR